MGWQFWLFILKYPMDSGSNWSYNLILLKNEFLVRLLESLSEIGEKSFPLFLYCLLFVSKLDSKEIEC